MKSLYDTMKPYHAFIGSMDDKNLFEISSLDLDEPMLVRKALINYSTWEDGAPIMKDFQRDPSYAPLRLPIGSHPIIQKVNNSDRYYFDEEVECWYKF